MNLQQDPRDIIIQVLSIIGYKDNKDAYTDEFLQNCEKQALLDLLTALSQDKQEEFKQRLTKITDKEQHKILIHEFIKAEQFQQVLQKASQNAFVRFVQDVLPTLSREQFTRLQTYLKSIVFLHK